MPLNKETKPSISPPLSLSFFLFLLFPSFTNFHFLSSIFHSLYIFLSHSLFSTTTALPLLFPLLFTRYLFLSFHLSLFLNIYSLSSSFFPQFFLFSSRLYLNLSCSFLSLSLFFFLSSYPFFLFLFLSLHLYPSPLSQPISFSLIFYFLAITVMSRGNIFFKALHHTCLSFKSDTRNFRP